MPTLSQLVRNRRTVEIPTESDPLIITYQPAAITPRLEAIAESITGRDDVTRKEQLEMMAEYLIPVLYTWNLTEADGITPMPVTPDTITGLDYEAKVIIFAAITEDLYPGEVNGGPGLTPSDSTAQPTAQRATSPRRSRTGTR